MIEVADFSDAARGEVRLGSLIGMCLLAPCVVAYLAGQWLLDFHEDKWDGRLEEAGQTIAKEQMLRDEARRYRDFLNLLERLFRQAVAKRVQQLKQVLQAVRRKGADEPEPVRLPAVLRALAPTQQITWLVHTIYEWCTRQMEMQHPGKDHKVRVALFQMDDNRGCLIPAYAWDGKSADCLNTPPEKYEERFSLGSSQTACLAVWVAVRGELRIVPDTEQADRDQDHPFHYFEPKQRKTIRSMLVIPLLDDGKHTPASYVVSVDTNLKGYFDDGRAEEYEALAESLAQRLHHEFLLNQLLQEVSKSEGEEP